MILLMTIHVRCLIKFYSSLFEATESGKVCECGELSTAYYNNFQEELPEMNPTWAAYVYLPDEF